MGPSPITTDPPRWSLIQRVAFRFVFGYLILYSLPFPVDALPLDFDREKQPALFEWVTTPYHESTQKITRTYRQGMDAAVLWIGKHVFDVELTIRPAGSGDTTWNYVQVFGFAAASAVLTLIWSLIDFRRPSYPRLHEFLRVYIRYHLALILFSYGVVKVIKTQFPTPGPDRLLVPYGESSPMRLLWTFMGVSEPYNWFTGGGELLGGLLLLTRRTTLLGALVTFGVMLHVAVLNFCYDVPVKLFSMNLIFMAVFLMAPEMSWLARVFLLGKTDSRPPITPLTRWRWVNCALVVLRTVFVVATLWQGIESVSRMRRTMGDLAPKPPLGGMWETDEFTADGKVLEPLTTDNFRWRYAFVVRGRPGTVSFIAHSMTGINNYYSAKIDTEQQTIALARLGVPADSPDGTPRPPAAEFKYGLSDAGVLTIEGKLGQRQIKVRLHHVDENDFLLLNRGFHWINETPYNVALPRTSADPPK